MRCSNCSRKVRPIVVLDIDGTLGNYHDSFQDFASRYWNTGRTVQLVGSWDGRGDFEDHLALTREMYREAKLAYRQGGGKRILPVYAGAREMVEAIRREREYPAEIWLATTRPWMRFDSTDPDTRFWLDKNGFYYDHLLYDDGKYQRLSEILLPAWAWRRPFDPIGCEPNEIQRVVFILEDLGEQYDQAEKIFPGRVWQISRPHNAVSEASRPRKVETLALAQEIMFTAVKNWYERNDRDDL